MNLVDLGARSKFLTNIEFAELDCLAEKIGSRAAWSSAKHPLHLFYPFCYYIYCGSISYLKIMKFLQ
jgi:hypothetical protein